MADIPEETAGETIERLLGAGVWAFSRSTPNRTKVKPGDRMAFYQAGLGVVASADVATPPAENPMPDLVKNSGKYSWTFTLTNVRMLLDDSIAG